MSQQLVIEPSVFAREARTLQGELSVVGLTRLSDWLADTTGVINYRIDGQMSGRKRSQLVLQVDGALSLRCQRCLDAIAYPLRARNLLEFVDDEDELTQEEIEDDTRDFLPWQKEIDVAALIEDEIILVLPSAPRHESCALPKSAQEDAMDREDASPFSVLKQLKNKATT